MPRLQTVLTNVLYSAAGVMVAGWTMNALRQFAPVRAAIQGFDA